MGALQELLEPSCLKGRSEHSSLSTQWISWPSLPRLQGSIVCKARAHQCTVHLPHGRGACQPLQSIWQPSGRPELPAPEGTALA